MGSGKVLASVLAGVAAGAILGILFAPDKGTETRRKIAEKGSDLADSLKDKYAEIADLNQFTEEEVSKLEILKPDNMLTALYGTNGLNGVVKLETK